MRMPTKWPQRKEADIASTPVPTAVVPPAPVVHSTDLPASRALWTATRSNLTIWPNYAFDALFHRRRMLGVDVALVNDPDGVRQVLATNTANYRRSIAVRR